MNRNERMVLVERRRQLLNRADRLLRPMVPTDEALDEAEQCLAESRRLWELISN